MKALKFASILACLSVAHLTAMEKQYDQQVQPSRATQKSQGPSLLDAYLLLTLRETPLPVVDAMNLDEPNTDGILRVTNGEFVMPVPAKVPAIEEWSVIEESQLDLHPSAEEQLPTPDRASLPLRDYEVKLAQLVETLGIERTNLNKDYWKELVKRLQAETQYSLSSLQKRLRDMAKNHSVTKKNKEIYTKLASASGNLYFQSIDKTKRLSEPLRDFEVELATQVKSLGIQQTDLNKGDWKELAIRLKSIAKKAFSTLYTQLTKMAKNHTVTAQDKQVYKSLSNACYWLYHHKSPDGNEEPATTTQQLQDQAPQPARAAEDAMDLDVSEGAEEGEDRNSDAVEGEDISAESAISAIVEEIDQGGEIVIEAGRVDVPPSAEEQFQTTDRASLPLRDYEMKLAQLVETLGIERTDLSKDEWKELATRLKNKSKKTFSTLDTRLRNMAKNQTVTPKNKEIYTKLSSACYTLYLQSVDKAKRLSEPLRDFEVELANHIKSLGIQETDMDAKSWEELAVRLGNISQKAFSTLYSQLAKMSRNHNLDAADKQIYRMLSNACQWLYKHELRNRGGEQHMAIQQQDPLPAPAEDAMDLDVDLAAEEREDKSSEQDDYDAVRLVPLAGPKMKLSLAGFNRELLLTYLDKEGFREFMHTLDEAFAKLTLGCGLKNFEQYTDALSGLVDFEYHKLRVFVGTSKSTFAYVYNFPYVMDTGEELLLHYHPHKKGDDFAGWSVLSRIVKEKRPQRILKDTNEELIRSIVDELGLVEVHDNLENRDWEQHLKLISEKTKRKFAALRQAFKAMRDQTDKSLEPTYYAIFQKLMNAAERLYTQELKSAPLLPYQHDLAIHVTSLQINEGNHDAETWKKWVTTLQEKTGKGFGTLQTQLIVLASNSHVLEPYKSIYVKLGKAGQSIYRKQHSKGLKRKRPEDTGPSERDHKRQRKE